MSYPSRANELSAPTKSRFAVVYHLLSLQHNLRIRLKSYCQIQDATSYSIASVTAIWSVANWYEREAYDLFGINFIGHPDLTRILLTADFVGYPLQKDFPIVGTMETYYDADSAQIQQRPVTVADKTTVAKVLRTSGEACRNLMQDKL